VISGKFAKIFRSMYYYLLRIDKLKIILRIMLQKTAFFTEKLENGQRLALAPGWLALVLVNPGSVFRLAHMMAAEDSLDQFHKTSPVCFCIIRAFAYIIFIYLFMD
jgi:hypothetical protein